MQLCFLRPTNDAIYCFAIAAGWIPLVLQACHMMMLRLHVQSSGVALRHDDSSWELATLNDFLDTKMSKCRCPSWTSRRFLWDVTKDPPSGSKDERIVAQVVRSWCSVCFTGGLNFTANSHGDLQLLNCKKNHWRVGGKKLPLSPWDLPMLRFACWLPAWRMRRWPPRHQLSSRCSVVG